MVFDDILGFCLDVLGSIQVFADKVFQVLNYEVSVFGETYSVFTVMFGAGIFILLTTSIARFILGLGN